MNKHNLLGIMLALAMGASGSAQGQAILYKSVVSMDGRVTEKFQKPDFLGEVSHQFIIIEKTIFQTNTILVPFQDKNYVAHRNSNSEESINTFWDGNIFDQKLGKGVVKIRKTRRGGFSGMIGFDESNISYSILPVSDSISYLSLINHTNIRAGCGNEPHSERPAKPSIGVPYNNLDTLKSRKKRDSHKSNGKNEDSSFLDIASEVKILVVFTKRVNQVTGSSELDEDVIDALKTTYNNSSLSNVINPKCVGFIEVDYNDSANTSFNSHINNLKFSGGNYSAMDNVLTLKNITQADIVVLIVRSYDSNNGTTVLGVAAGPQASQSSISASDAFCVIWYGTLYDPKYSYTPAHEIGHIFGNWHHDTNNSLPFPYGHGYYFTSQNGSKYWADAMASGNVSANTTRLNYFCDPNKIQDGVYAGTYSLNDATRVHREQAFTVSNFASVPANSVVPGTSVGSGQYLEVIANATIETQTNQSVLATSGSDVRFVAGTTVTLKPGFKAATGSKFVAKIGAGATASEALNAPVPVASSARSAAAEEEPETPNAKSDATESDKPTLPTEFSLFQNYPNPFNPSTTIRYALPSSAKVSLAVYDILGRKVIELVNERKAAGFYEVPLNAGRLSSGTYFYRLQAEEFVETKKMVLVK